MENKSEGNKRILAAAMITAFMTTFMSSALNLSVPALEEYFGVSAAAIGWIISTYTITVAATSLPWGRLADLTGHRKVFLCGVGGFGLLSFASIFAASFPVLIALRTASGICAGMIFSTNNALLIRSYPHEVQGKVLGYSTAATYIGLSTGPVIGGFLNSAFGWRSVFAVSVLISAAAFIAGLGAAKSESSSASEGGILYAHGDHHDISGVLLYIFAIGMSLYGMTSLGSGIRPAVMLAAGAAALTVFFIHESRAESPIMRVSMFSRSRAFTFSCLAALLNYGATFAISYSISIYLQVIKGMSSGHAGLILIVMPAMQAVFSPVAGSLSDRIRPAVLASTGMGICAFTLLLFSSIGTGTHLAYIVFALCLTGFGFALFSSPNTNAIMNCVQPDEFGVANSIVATMRTYGQSSSLAVISIITTVVLGTGSLGTSPPSDITRMLHTSFLIFAVICVIGLFFSLARDREK